MQASFDGQLLKLVNAITVDSMGCSGDAQPLPPSNLYEPLFEVTHSGWYWQITPLAPANGRKLVSPSLATGSLPSPAAKKVAPDESGARWLNVKGPKGEPLRIVEVIDTLGHEPGKPSYSIVVAGPQDWLDHLVANFRYRLTTALALAGLGLVAVTLFQVRFGLLPLRQIERGLAGIRSGTSSTLEGDLPAEIEPLQSELNALIRSNQAIVDRARTQVGNLAHALKTPLAVITNEARGDKTGLGAKVVEQAEIMRQSMTRYLDRARMAARVGVIGRVTPVRSGHRAAGAHAAAHPPGQGRRHQRRVPGGCALLRREAGPGGDAGQPARQRLQVGAARGDADASRCRRRPAARATAACRSPSPTTGRASTTSSAPASASGGCVSTRRSPAPGSGCRSSWSWPTPTAARASWRRRQAGRPGSAPEPAGRLNSVAARFAAKRPAFGHGRRTFVG